MPGLRATVLSVPSASSSSTRAPIKAAPTSVAVQQSTATPSVPTAVLTASCAVPALYTVVSHSQPPVRLEHKADLSMQGDSRVHLHEISTAVINYSSSGSPHDDPSTVCLAAMVHEFLENEVSEARCGRARCNCVDGVCGYDEENESLPDEHNQQFQLTNDHLCEILEGITSCTNQPELSLIVDVARAVEAESEELAAISGAETLLSEQLRRPVMKRLRQDGYNAAICKSRWNHGDGLPAGDYEYIDIVLEGNGGSKKQERFIVDIDFRAQFEIARASDLYVQLLGVLPRLFVGRAERLKQILKIMSNAAKCSLKQQGLLLPPWRKHKYMQAKWFSSYRRTIKTESARSPLQSHEHIFGLGIRTPKILSLDFSKEMDLLFYRAQLRGLGNPNGHHRQTSHKRLLSNNVENVNVGVVRTGFGNNSSDCLSPVPEGCITARCTDWQLPAVDDKWKTGTSRDRISGISTALKEQETSSLLDHPMSLQQVAMMS